jgi:geranylgeranyl transferase type-2 subunit alpha
MHSVRRNEVPTERSQEELSKEKAKIELYRSLIKRLSLAEASSDILSISQSILSLNTESYQTWNLRKCALKSIGVNALGDELLFNVEMLKLNPKSYCCWHHRHWLLSELLNVDVVAFDWKHELRLCSKLLHLDSRNCMHGIPNIIVHCWNHRMFVVDRFKVPLRDELDFTTEMIYSNFSNYSAWHHRTRLLGVIKSQDPELFNNTIEAG